MKSLKPVILSGRRIVLHSIENIIVPEVTSLVDFIKNNVGDSKKGYLFKISVRDSEILLGYCGFIQVNDLNAVCFYFLFPEYRGNGYAIEAVKKMFEFVFKTLKLVEIRAYIEMDNNRGWKVAERAGMMYMGDYSHEEPQIKLMRFKISNTDFVRQIFY